MPQTHFVIAKDFAVCPHCGGGLYLEVDEWESETGIPTEAGCHVRCRHETEQDDDPHWQMPYVTLLPLEHKVYVWARQHIRVTESEAELRARMADWNADKPLPGGMTQ